MGVRRAGTAGPTRPSCVGSTPATLSRILPNGPKTVRDVCSMCVVCVAHPTAPVAIWESNEYCNAQPSWGVTALQRTVLATTACLVWNHVSEIAISDACILLANAFLEVIGGLTSETASHALRDRSITATAIATLRAWPHPSRSHPPTAARRANRHAACGLLQAGLASHCPAHLRAHCVLLGSGRRLRPLAWRAGRSWAPRYGRAC